MPLLWIVLPLLIKTSMLPVSICGDTSVTQTVYGFLDYTTTIGSTVMIFSPRSAPNLEVDFQSRLNDGAIHTKPVYLNDIENKIVPTKITNSSYNYTASKIASSMGNNTAHIKKTINAHSALGSDEILQAHRTFQPEYDLLSRQPSEYVEETYRLITHKTKSRPSNLIQTTLTDAHNHIQKGDNPVGLVTKFLEAKSKDGLTQIHETSIIGTYISGSYAQVIQSSFYPQKNSNKKIRLSSVPRVLKTTSPASTKELTNKEKSRRQYTGNKSASKRNLTFVASDVVQENYSPAFEVNIKSKKESRRGLSSRNKNRRRKDGRTEIRTSISNSSLDLPEKSLQKSSKPKIQPTSVDRFSLTSLKLNRAPGRWQYKTPLKPRVPIRKTSIENKESSNNYNIESILLDENNPSEEATKIVTSNWRSIEPQQLRIEKNNSNSNRKSSSTLLLYSGYYDMDETSISAKLEDGSSKSNLIDQDGYSIDALSDQKTPLTENILQSSQKENCIWSECVASTLNTVHISKDNNTPYLETFTESFMSTQTKIRTQILPIIFDINNETSFLSLLQTYDITNLITVTRTVPSKDATLFTPSKNFKDFGGILEEAGSEINLDLEFGDYDNMEPHTSKSNFTLGDIKQINLNKDTPNEDMSRYFITDLPLRDIQNYNFSNEARFQPNRNQERTVAKLEEISNIAETRLNSLHDSTSVGSYNPFIVAPPQLFRTITSPLVYPTVTTQTKSKTLKLTFGARTTYTTIFSSEILPTTVTKFITTSELIQPTPAFPGYFPHPYPQFGYIG